MNEITIQCEHGPQLLISRSPDGKYLVRVLSSVGQMVAHLFVSIEEMEKIQYLAADVGESPKGRFHTVYTKAGVRFRCWKRGRAHQQNKPA